MEWSEKIVRQRRTPSKAMMEIQPSSSFNGRRNHSIMMKIIERMMLKIPLTMARATHFIFSIRSSEKTSVPSETIPGRIGTTLDLEIISFFLKKLDIFIIITFFFNSLTINNRPIWPI